MPKYVIAKQLGGKKVITNSGEEVGRLVDAVIDGETGKIESVLLRPSADTPLYRKLKKTEDGLVVVPFSTVVAIADVVVVDERKL